MEHGRRAERTVAAQIDGCVGANRPGLRSRILRDVYYYGAYLVTDSASLLASARCP